MAPATKKSPTSKSINIRDPKLAKQPAAKANAASWPTGKKPAAKTVTPPKPKTTSEPEAKPLANLPAGFKLPKNLAECGDLLYTTQQARFKLKKELDEMQAKETALKEHLINKLPKSEASGISGKLARVTINTKTIASVTDWDKVNAYILANGKKNPGVFALYQRRIGEATVKEMWEAGKAVPGVEPMDIPTVSINKL